MPRNDYWGWSHRPAPQAKTGSYRRKYGTSWWGKEFLSALQRLDYSGRLSRGQTYANKGLVEEMKQPAPGRITAAVQGSMPRPYAVTFDWQPWQPQEGKIIVEEIRKNPALLGQLLTGALPEEIMQLLKDRGMTIFPDTFAELRAKCSCPDWAVPCKHMAAVIYVMAGAIDNDPFELFRMRGLDLRAELVGTQDEAILESDAPPLLADLLQPVAGIPPFQWDEELATSIDFGGITDGGWQAVRRLPTDPAFDSAGDFPSYVEKIFTTSARFADRLWLRDDSKSGKAGELLPPGGQLELHLNADLQPTTFAAYNDEDEPLLEIRTEAGLLDWLLQVEQLERHQLNKEARSLLLGFQLARTLVQRKSFVPRLLVGSEGAYLVQYVPATADDTARDILDKFYRLTAPTLLYYVDPEGTFLEFRADREGEQLLATLMGCIIRRATEKLTGDTPARRLFLLGPAERFTLVGTEGFGAAIHRWLGQLYLADRRFRPIVKVEEGTDGLTVEVLIDDREAAGKQPPVPLAEWLPGAERHDRLTIIKTLSFLSGHFPELHVYLAGNGNSPMRFTVAKFAPVLTAVLPSMEALGVRVLLPGALRKLLRPALGLSAQTKPGTEVFELSGIISLDNILSFSWQAALGDELITEAEFRKLVGTANGLVKFKENYVLLDEAEVARLLKALDAGEPALKPHERLEALFTEEYDGAPVRIGPELRKLIDGLRNGPAPAPPAGLQATLRPYQSRGYAWLHTNAGLGFGSVLADDMGLGKTLQVITLLLKYAEEGLLNREKAIIVVPTSLLGNWHREMVRFAPALRAQVYHGSQRKLPETDDYEVLLTTYGIARTEETTLGKLAWRVLVIDEAQNIKNPMAKQTRAVKKLKAPVRIAMSGTPVENRLLDYWSLLDFTLPKFLGSRKHFNEHYGRPIQGEHDQRAAARFQKLTAPFVLRRLKTDKSIISDLPDKVVQTEYCALTAEQTALYQSILEENMRLVRESEDGIGRQGLILKLITALKQCCNHPAQFLKQGAADFTRSGKGLLLHERLTGILENNDKAIIFTQYREMGELLQQMIRDSFGLDTPFLHGGTATKDRDGMVERFQTDTDCPLLLISIKAGGTGLNLTAANHVIHYDLWWNPAVEAQATDRAYRIGQQRTVFVHRLVTERTFEEKIDQLIQSKQEVADLSVVEGEKSLGKMTNREIGELVRLG
ncbi:superfamily II DNA or RNA helicase [Lewinella aquimaris]|uniref:Superfamily II DNA or RNA helicase n=1 Tax=Neolewinella aquimaris TaxID=1835722 RepID=A0A840EHQ1_9BACT|nr:SNF2-related protein [Neolewinella aquimaris]MBB4080426.1 superfamily II DNA or RNA helicase [Neolewinella aquimaris]